MRGSRCFSPGQGLVHVHFQDNRKYIRTSGYDDNCILREKYLFINKTSLIIVHYCPILKYNAFLGFYYIVRYFFFLFLHDNECICRGEALNNSIL